MLLFVALVLLEKQPEVSEGNPQKYNFLQSLYL